MDTRRDFLKKIALMAGAAGFSDTLLASIQRAATIDPSLGSSYPDAEHVVILMQENRSFDHCFGTLRGVRGFNDPRAITLPNKNLVWMQTDTAGDTFAPFRFDITQTKATWMGSTPHTRSSQVDAFNLGKHDQWLNAKRVGKYPDMPLTMGYFTRDDLPFNYALADAFTICDQHFSSAMSSTWPNRLYMWSGTITDTQRADKKVYVRNDIPYGEATWKTFPERLEEHGISWKVYQNDLATGGGFTDQERFWLANYICNLLEFLSQYNVKFSSRYVESLQNLASSLPDEIASLKAKLSQAPITEKETEKIRKAITKKEEVLNNTHQELLQWSKERFDALTPYQKSLYQRAFTTNAGDPDYHTLTSLKYEENGESRELVMPKGDVLYQFRKDVDSDQLPVVSWLVAPRNFSDHPSTPWYGNLYTSEILDILTKNPETWKKTIFILTYDENDGYFDHIPPFVAPDPMDTRSGKCSPGINTDEVEYTRREQEILEGIPAKEARTGPIGLGFRVPMIIASPWSRGGKVCSQVFDHTSSLQFLEEFIHKKFDKKISETNISEWRRTICGNLTSVFGTYQGEEKEKLPFLSRDHYFKEIYNAKFKNLPGNFKKLSAKDMDQLNQDPSSSSQMPRQEPGVRPSTPLPYQLYADGRLSPDKKHIELTMQAQNAVFGKQSAGSPFNVYAPGEYLARHAEGRLEQVFEPVRVWHFAVKAGDRLTNTWPLSAFKENGYHLRAYGPNGFFREFMGDADDPTIQLDCEYERGRTATNTLTGNIALEISNFQSDTALHLTISDNAYNTKPMVIKIPASGKEKIILDLTHSFGWYDFSVGIAGSPIFLKRYAGRVDTGSESYSDPFMGKDKGHLMTHQAEFAEDSLITSADNSLSR